MFSVEFSPDLVQIQVRETVSGVFLTRRDIPIQAWHMMEVMRRDFNDHHMSQVLMTEPTWRNAIDGGSFWSYGKEVFRDSWLKICSSTRRRLPLSLWGGSISRKPHHKRWRLGFLRNNDTSKYSSTTITSKGTSSSSALDREPPELFCCSTALWLNNSVNNCCLVLFLFFVIN